MQWHEAGQAGQRPSRFGTSIFGWAMRSGLGWECRVRLEKAITSERWHNDVLGVWHDILHMSKWMIVKRISESYHLFQVIIKGAGRKSTFTFKAECGPLDIDDPTPSVTISLRDED